MTWLDPRLLGTTRTDCATPIGPCPPGPGPSVGLAAHFSFTDAGVRAGGDTDEPHHRCRQTVEFHESIFDADSALSAISNDVFEAVPTVFRGFGRTERAPFRFGYGITPIGVGGRNRDVLPEHP